MKCKHDDCFTCPYPDCILANEPYTRQQRYYRKNREKIIAYQREYQKTYNKRPDVIEKRKERQRLYRSTEEYKAKRRKKAKDERLEDKKTS